MLQDRAEAGRLLAKELHSYQVRTDVVVLGLARGGVPVARVIADALGAPVDALLVRKLGVPSQPELGFGAIAEGGVRVIDQGLVRKCHLNSEVVQEVAGREQRQTELQRRIFQAFRPDLAIRNKVVILVDDGLATGLTMVAAVRSVHQRGAARIVVAVPVGSRTACRTLRSEADEVVCLFSPEPFYSVGTWYQDFSQVTDGEVQEALAPTTTQ